MSENLHDIDKLFKDSIEGHEEMPSDKVWDAIDNNLDKTNVIQIKRKYNNLKRLAVALLLLLLGTVVYEIQSKKSGKGELVQQGSKDTKEPANIDGTKAQKNTAEEKTGKNTAANKTNGSDNTATATNGTAADNREVNNAGKDQGTNEGKDALNSTKQKSEQNAEATTTGRNSGKEPLNKAIQQGKEITDQKTAADLRRNLNATKSRTKMKTRGSVTGNEDAIANTNEKTGEQLNNKNAIKKSSTRKTKIRIKNSTPEEDLATEENDATKNAADKTSASAGVNELRRLQNDKAEKLVAVQKNTQLNITEKRISPDANVNNTVAKSRSIKNPKPFHFNVTAFYSPQFSSTNRLEDEHHDPTAPPPPPGSGREEIKKDEPHEKSSSLGVLVQVPVGKKWSLQSGVTYTSKQISIEPKKIFAKLDNDGKVKYRFDCSSGYTYISPKTGTNPAVGDSVNAAASTNTLQYIGIPLAVNYTISLGKFSIVPTVGAGINFLTKQRIETELIQGTTKEKQTINTIQGLKKTYYNAFAGVALEYNLSKRIALSVAPSGNFALSSINKDAAVKSYPKSFGVAAGIKIKF